MQLASVDELTADRTVDQTEDSGPGRRRSAGHNERLRSILVIVAVVVLANAPYLLQLFNPNPINQVSGLGTTVQPGLLPGQDTIDPNIGFTAQALGHRAAVDWLHGQVPWWNPYEGVGAPLAGEMQSAAFFPLDAFNLLPGGQVYFRITLEIVAGIATYLLLRRLTRSNTAAVVGGIAFGLNGTMAWLFHAPGNPVAFLPLLLLGIEWALDGARLHRRTGWVLIAVALALSLYAGFPEMAFLDGLLALLWLVVRSMGLPRRALGTLAQSVAMGVGTAALLAAPILVAFVDYLPHANVGGHAGAFGHTSLSPRTALPAQVMPYLFGPIFEFSSARSPDLASFWGSIGGYFGAAVCLSGIVGLVGRPYRSLRVALGAWIVVGLARLVGVGVALDVVNAIPGVSSTAFYRYAPASWELAVVVLAALGLDDVIRRSASRRIVLGSGAVLLAAVFLCWRAAEPVLRSLPRAPQQGDWVDASVLWALIVILGMVGLALAPDAVGRATTGRIRIGALAALVVVDVMAMFMTPQFSAPRQAVVDVAPVHYLARHLGEQRFYTLGPLSPDYGSYYGLSSAGLNDVPIPDAYGTYVVQRLDPNVNPTTFTGTTRLDPTGRTPARELVDHLRAYEAVGVKYVLLPSGTTLPGGASRLRTVFSDATTTIVALPHPAPLFSAGDRACSVRVTGQTTAVVNCRRPSALVYREQQMPGWHATANGRPLAVRTDGPLFQAVDLPAGRSSVSFSFTPPYAALALLAGALGLVCLVLAWAAPRRLFRRVRRRRSPAPGHGVRGSHGTGNALT